jgi:hypothetical protein
MSLTFRVVVLTGLTLLVLALNVPGQSPPIKIGLLFPYTGPISTIGQDATKGFELHLAKIGGRAGGRELQLVKEDDEFKPDVGLTKTRKLVERDRVDLLVGPVNSAVALAIRDYVTRQGIPLVVPVAFSKELTAPGKATPWLFRVVETTDQGNFAMGEWIYKNTPHRRMVIMSPLREDLRRVRFEGPAAALRLQRARRRRLAAGDGQRRPGRRQHRDVQRCAGHPGEPVLRARLRGQVQRLAECP